MASAIAHPSDAVRHLLARRAVCACAQGLFATMQAADVSSCNTEELTRSFGWEGGEARLSPGHLV